MTLHEYSIRARQARALMPQLSSAVAYAQMDQLMGRTEPQSVPITHTPPEFKSDTTQDVPTQSIASPLCGR